MLNVRGFASYVLHNLSTLSDMTFQRGSSSASIEIHYSEGSQNAGRCSDMPTLPLRLTLYRTSQLLTWFVISTVWINKLFIYRVNSHLSELFLLHLHFWFIKFSSFCLKSLTLLFACRLRHFYFLISFLFALVLFRFVSSCKPEIQFVARSFSNEEAGTAFPMQNKSYFSSRNYFHLQLIIQLMFSLLFQRHKYKLCLLFDK